MLSKWTSKFKSALFRVVQPFIDAMYPPPPTSLFPTDFVDVDVYATNVAGSYIFKAEKPLENAQHFTVDELRLYKERKHPFHEYVLARVVTQKSQTAFLRWERTRSKKDDCSTKEALLDMPERDVAKAFRKAFDDGKEATPKDFEEAGFSPSSPISENHISSAPSLNKPSRSVRSLSSTSISESLSDSLRTHNLTRAPAKDSVVVGSPIDDDKLVLILRPNNLPLARLALLAAIVHEYDPYYNVFSRQCYWYANLIMKVIEREDPKGHRVEEPPKAIALARRGTWLNIPVGMVWESMVNVISQHFDAQWKEHLAKFEIHNRGRLSGEGRERNEQERNREADERVEAERKRAEAEKLRADEAERALALVREQLRQQQA